jgi:hypothetical protein
MRHKNLQKNDARQPASKFANFEPAGTLPGNVAPELFLSAADGLSGSAASRAAARNFWPAIYFRFFVFAACQWDFSPANFPGVGTKQDERQRT